MRIVTNEKLIKRNSQIGRYSVLVGTVLLIGALVINLLAFTRPNDSALLFYVIAAFFVGFTLTNIGTLFNNRWGRRPDKGLADSLKGLDDRYALYSYRLGASHPARGSFGPIGSRAEVPDRPGRVRRQTLAQPRRPANHAWALQP